MEDLIGKFTVVQLWGTPYERRRGDNSLSSDEWNEYCRLKEALVPDGHKRFICSKGSKATFSGCNFFVLGPRDSINNDENRECHDACLVVWINTPANNFIICGDASDSELENIRGDYELSTCTVLRASHHGSENGSNLEFIKAVSPRDTIISTQSGIISSLPSDLALRRYRDYSKKVFRTDLDDTCTTPLKS
jgi:beta-lactamase superfamily II metal-dependent hydrolase